MNAIQRFLEDQGYNLPRQEYYEKIDEYIDWYMDGQDDFHKLKWFNGIQQVSREMARLGMAKIVCEDWANLLLNEKVEIRTENERSQEVLDEVLANNKFEVNGNRLIEKSFAFGTGAFVEYLDGDSVSIDYITANQIFPLRWDSKGIHDCAFGSEHMEGKDKVYYVQIHERGKDGKYQVKNHCFKENASSDGFEEIALPKNMVAVWNTGYEEPLFQIVKPNIVNNYDLLNPMGMSVYGNAFDILKQLDTCYDSMGCEITLSRKRVFLRTDMFGVDAQTGKTYDAIDKGDTVFHYLSGGFSEDQPFIHEYSSEMRIAQFKDVIQENLNLLAKKCGMGTNYYTFDQKGVRTATEIISENSDLFDSINKHEIILKDVLVNMAKSVLRLSNINEDTVTVTFDDSIMQDTDAIRQQALVEFNAGLIDAVVYFERVYDMDEEQAKKFVAEVEARKPKEEEIPEEGA